MMSDQAFTFDCSQWERYFALLRKAGNGEFKKAMAEWFEACGYEFLNAVQDEIINRHVVDTRLLLHSFTKGDNNNVWEIHDGGLTLEVGTNLEYAEYVNDGHWTCKKGELSRWVPGIWSGDRFTYDPGAKTGMLLKQKWIEGYHYWEAAVRIFGRMFRASMEKKMQQWGDEFFKR